MRHGVTRDDRPRAPYPDDGMEAAAAAVRQLAAKAKHGLPKKRLAPLIATLLLSWREEPITRTQLRERLEGLQADVDGGIVDAEEYAALAETDGERRHAEAQRDALTAMREAVLSDLADMKVLL